MDFICYECGKREHFSTLKSNCDCGGLWTLDNKDFTFNMDNVNKDDCIGCGLCEDICPEVFKMDDEGMAVVIVDSISAEAEASAKEAEESCPTDAIIIED